MCFLRLHSVDVEAHARMLKVCRLALFSYICFLIVFRHQMDVIQDEEKAIILRGQDEEDQERC